MNQPLIIYIDARDLIDLGIFADKEKALQGWAKSFVQANVMANNTILAKVVSAKADIPNNRICIAIEWLPNHMVAQLIGELNG